MPALSTELFDSAVAVLAPFMRTKTAREAQLTPIGDAVLNGIEWDGDPTEFTVRLVRHVSYDQLLLLLRRLTVGEEQRRNIDLACARIEQERTGSETTQTHLRSKIVSSAIAHVVALLDQGNIREALVRLNDITREFSPQHHAQSTTLASKIGLQKNPELTALIRELASSILRHAAQNGVKLELPTGPSEGRQTEWRKEYLKRKADLESSNSVVLSCNNLTRAYPKHNFALQAVTFDLLRGEMMAVIGANASGKTTLLNLIAGIVSADEGGIGLHPVPKTPS